MPEQFLPACDVEFTMPLATISNTVVRSVSIEQHEDSDRVEKFVRYVAKCQYTVDIDYVQCNDLDNDAIFDPMVVNPEAAMASPLPQHKPVFDPDEVQQQHTGYVQLLTADFHTSLSATESIFPSKRRPAMAASPPAWTAPMRWAQLAQPVTTAAATTTSTRSHECLGSRSTCPATAIRLLRTPLLFVSHAFRCARPFHILWLL